MRRNIFRTHWGRLDRGGRSALLVLLFVLVSLAPAVALLWPGPAKSLAPDGYKLSYVTATLRSIDLQECESTTSAQCSGPVQAELEGGQPISFTAFRGAAPYDLTTGDRVILQRISHETGAVEYVLHAPARGWQLVSLAAITMLIVTVFASSKGVRAVLSLVAASAFIWSFLVGGVAAGGSPVLHSAVSAAVALTAVLFFTHGLSAQSLASWMGTLTGLGAALLGGQAMSKLLRLGPGDDASAIIAFQAGVGVSELSLAVLIIVLIGILNDVAAAQAATTFSHLSYAKNAVRRSLAVGRDHVASAIYTVSFSILGAGLGTYVVAQMSGQHLGAVIQSDATATVIVQALAGIIGVSVAMPATTLAATVLARRLSDAGTAATEELAPD